MKRPDLTNIAIFLLFFGIALIEAIKKQNWLEAALFLALGVISLLADIREKIRALGKSVCRASCLLQVAC